MTSEIREGGERSWNLSYKYDASGNRISKVESGKLTTYKYGTGNCLLTERAEGGETTHFAYNEGGNLISEANGSNVVKRKWNAEGRLTEYLPSAGSAESYRYNADGIRISKTLGNTKAVYVLDGQNVVAEIGEANSLTSWTHANNKWGGLIAEHRNEATSVLGFDMSANLRFASDVHGDVVSTFVSDAFGAERGEDGRKLDTPHRFGGLYGYWRDGPNRYYIRARHYLAGYGRWASRDPIGFRGGDWNLYRYVGVNPVTHADAEGKIALTAEGIPSINPATNCYFATTSASDSYATHDNYIKVYAKFLSEVSNCMPQSGLNAFATAMTCIGKAESSFDPHSISSGGKGLMQIDQLHFDVCTRGTPICNNTAQIDAAIRMVGWFCKSEQNIYQAIFRFWGSVQGQSPEFANCIRDHGVSVNELKKISCSCQTCPRCYRAWH